MDLQQLETFLAVAEERSFSRAAQRLLRTQPAVSQMIRKLEEELKATPEGNGSLLDHSLYLYGSGMGNPNLHDHVNLPILVAGGAAGKMRGGRHIRYEKPTPLANLHLTLLDKVGVRLNSFADSRGKIDELFEPLSI